MPAKDRIRVIIVTDGDQTAQEALEIACRGLNIYPLKATGGNPTPLCGQEVLQHILAAPYEPVVVMVDDRGCQGKGAGEQIIEYLLNCREEIVVLGVVAVASNTRVKGVQVSFSVDCHGKVVDHPVDKSGRMEVPKHHRLEGDTVDILNQYPELLVVGCGDLGKMNGYDAKQHGAFVTTRCLEEILKGSKSNVYQENH